MISARDRRCTLGQLAALALWLGFEAAPGRSSVQAAEFEPNYDEARVPDYTLPDPLVTNAGAAVARPDQWPARRAELLELFRSHVYGRSPAPPRAWRMQVFDEDHAALGGAATRRQTTVYLGDDPAAPRFDLLLYLPTRRSGPAPVFLGLNFAGNQVVHADPAIRLTDRWVRDGDPDSIPGDPTASEHRAGPSSRGRQAESWMVERLVERGYGLATVYYGDFEPDRPDGWRSGVRAAFPVDGGGARTPAGQPLVALADDHWGAIAAWAWGLSRALDALERDPAVDARRVAVMGHSRLGKTALWAAAQDERFALAVSNNSGEGGAALARRRFGETVARINASFPHWFAPAFRRYDDREHELPVDQHELLALLAPRPLYVASASEDRWADPRGEFLAAVAAEPVYRLLGFTGLGTSEFPAADMPLGDRVGYHLRTGEHAVQPYDWERYLDFADRHAPPVAP